MHKSLLVSEIISRVCSELYSTYDSYPGTLAAFALTCHGISEPALDILWHTHSSIVPLLKCMSDELWGDSVESNHGPRLYIRRPIKPTDWPRLQFYAKRIRVLGFTRSHTQYDTSDIHQLDAEAFRTLILSKPDGTLCPNLHSLNWSKIILDDSEEEDAYMFPYIRHFLGPSTKHLILNLNQASLINLSIILSLPHDYPGITHLDLQQSSDMGYGTISDAVCQWNELRSFTWQDQELIYPALLLHLANLPNLQDISVLLPDQSHLSSFYQLGFRALRNAEFRCNNISSCTSLMDVTSSQCPIERMTVRIDQRPDTMSLRSFFQTLNARCSQKTLSEISIICSNRYHRLTPDQNIIDEETIQPLLAFRNMRHVTINIPRPFSLGNKTMRDITTSWTQLRSLAIGGPGGWGGHSRITLTGLISLLSLSKLDRLRIVIDASSVNHTLNMPKTGVPNTKLSILQLGDSVIHDAPSVAACLSYVLPNVRVIHSWGDSVANVAAISVQDAQKYQSRWKEVASLIEAAAK